ncbi:MAG: hypothetical protein ACRCWM_01315 [Sarcina sp.]
MTIAVQIIAILFMLTLMFIGIWSFIIANKAYNQFKYKNYLLEKIANHLAIITEKSFINETTNTEDIQDSTKNDSTEKESLSKDTFISEEEILSSVKELVDNPPLFNTEKE